MQHFPINFSPTNLRLTPFSIGSIVQSRQAKIWLQNDFLFRLTDDYKTHQSYINTLHGFSNMVIRERKSELSMANNNNNNNNMPDAYDDLGKKKRLAFLDLLIDASKEGTVLSNVSGAEETITYIPTLISDSLLCRRTFARR